GRPPPAPPRTPPRVGQRHLVDLIEREITRQVHVTGEGRRVMDQVRRGDLHPDISLISFQYASRRSANRRISPMFGERTSEIISVAFGYKSQMPLPASAKRDRCYFQPRLAVPGINHRVVLAHKKETERRYGLRSGKHCRHVVPSIVGRRYDAFERADRRDDPRLVTEHDVGAAHHRLPLAEVQAQAPAAGRTHTEADIRVFSRRNIEKHAMISVRRAFNERYRANFVTAVLRVLDDTVMAGRPQQAPPYGPRDIRVVGRKIFVAHPLADLPCELRKAHAERERACLTRYVGPAIQNGSTNCADAVAVHHLLH